FALEDGTAIEVRELVGFERLGEIPQFELSLFSMTPIDPHDVVDKGCGLAIETEFGSRRVGGIVTRFTAVPTPTPEQGRNYKAIVRPSFARLELARRRRIFQHKTAPAIIQQILGEMAYVSDHVKASTTESYDPREYVVQHDETDAAFVRRLC